MKNKNNGITLIALVITIIVMLILVAVTISMAINGGLFEYAGRATGDTKNAVNAEQQLANGHIVVDGKEYASIDDFLENKVIVDKGDRVPTGKKGIYTQGKKTAVIPGGFTVSGVPSESTIDGGLVIYLINDKTEEQINAIDWTDEETVDELQRTYDQFVWIPVNYTATGTIDENQLDSGFLSEFKRSVWEDNKRADSATTTSSPSSAEWSEYTEPYVDGYEEEDTEYYEMMRSVQENSGFYIGRYEAGSQKEDENGNLVPTARTNKANGTSKVVVKQDQYPYIYVGWGAGMSNYTENVTYSSKNQGQGALYLCKHMYDGKNIGATSTLCYGIQWDAMLDFIKDDTHNVTNSTSWGNYGDNAWAIDRTTASYSEDFGDTWTQNTTGNKSKTSSEDILLTTGADDSFSAKNIYDVAGNVREWTNEADSSTSDRVSRGGSFNLSGSFNPASCRVISYPTNCYNNLGFRPALYIK